MKRIFKNGDAIIEVLAHAPLDGGRKITDRFDLVKIVEGKEQAANDLFKKVISKFKNRPFQNWLDHHPL
jgi:hypothetical protein